MKPILILVNDQKTLSTKQSTWELARELAKTHETYVAGVRDMAIEPRGKVVAYGRRVVNGERSARGQRVDVDKAWIWARLNPGRARFPRTLPPVLECLALAQARGAVVLNPPSALWHAGSKVSLMALPPEARPDTLVAYRADVVSRWIRSRGQPAVVKPLVGTQGRGVVRVGPTEEIDPAYFGTDGNGVMAQAFLPEAPQGDIRVHLVDGEPLEVGGERAIVRRVPPEGEFRSNVALGGVPVAGEWTQALAEVVAAAGPTMRRLGLWHVGLDVVGNKVVEINAFSPGGLQDAGDFAGVDFVGALAEHFLERCSSAS